MTDRYAALVVTLKADIREDDAEPLIDAIRLLRGVASVRPVLAEGDLRQNVADERANLATREMLLRALAALK
jgi:hypothetical protein